MRRDDFGFENAYYFGKFVINPSPRVGYGKYIDCDRNHSVSTFQITYTALQYDQFTH